jgi:hypothetical protein
VYELLSREMNGKAVLCRQKPEWRSGRQLYSSAVMLLDCHRLTGWDWDRDIEQIFSCQLALGPWLSLLDVSPDEIGLFEDEWNDHDTLTNRTKLLHNTEILTQPWRTGLRASRYTYAPQILLSREWFRARVSRMVKRDPTRTLVYQRHPDPRQERMFFTLLKECLAQGGVSEGAIRLAMRRHWLRNDALAVLEMIPSPSGPMTSHVEGQR